jgi:hypothetical protein
VTEKLFVARDINIDQKAYIHLAIINPTGQNHYQLQDLVHLFKAQQSIQEPELRRWVHKLTNSGDEKLDQFCSCRAWSKRMHKRIVAEYGYSASDTMDLSTKYT